GDDRAALPGARTAPEGAPGGRADGASRDPYPPADRPHGLSGEPYAPGGRAAGVSQEPYVRDARPGAYGHEAQPDGASPEPYAPGGHPPRASRELYGSEGRLNGVSQEPHQPGVQSDGAAQDPYSSGGADTPPGRIADPYGVRATPWHGAGPRAGAPLPPAGQDRARTALPPGFRPADDGRGAPGATGPVPSGLPVPGAADGIPGIQALGPVVPDPAVPVPAAPGVLTPPPARWGDLAAGTPAPRRGPTTALAAERARQARMAVVGPVTERWAPEQAGPVHENWQLAAPIGPATDLWAMGALLFRAVQGHAPYPEESTAELVQMVCAEPPAFAEECGPLRPVVESLLRQDPTERPDIEELSGWLRSLVRSAPEPEAGAHVVAAPPADPKRLPIVRRRGELVRRRRAGLPAHQGRHKRAKQETGSPRSLGRTLLVLVLLGMAAAIAYAMLFMPKADQNSGAPADAGRAGATGAPAPDASNEPRPDQTAPGSGNSPSESDGSTEPQGDGPDVPDGFTLRKDDAGFQVAVANGWSRSPKNGRGQVVYSQGGFDLIVVPGRDTVQAYGGDPMVYQREKERELQPYRDSSWASSSGLKTIRVGERTMAEGQFTWTDGQGRELFVRNLALLVDGRYHVVQVRGPEAERDEVTRLFEQASATYQVTA
ncbi:serine/threonine protein kinase, partial [Streptomyces zinciresistens K42]